ncbi:MAG: hypothetical protein Q9203_002415 [Teloschistes exilis]
MDIKAVSFTDLVDAKVKKIAESEERLRFLTDLLLQHDGEERKDHGTLCVKSITQTPAEDIVKSFEGFLKDYDNIMQIFLPTERTLASLKPSYQDEELLKDVLRTQRSKTSQRVLALLHGDIGSSPANSGSLMASPQADIWYENHEAMSAEMDEHAAHNWSSTAHSVSRGVRRLVRDFPMETKT